MVKFKVDPELGQTVKDSKLFCSIGVDPIRNLDHIKFAAGGDKFSQLCGFYFDSLNDKIDYPRFSIAFVSKLRSKIYRQQQHNPSQWFIFKKINFARVDVLDKKTLLASYGFNIDKFFDSDLFKIALPKFKATIKKGIADCEKFGEKLKDTTQQMEVKKYIRALNESLAELEHSRRVNDRYFKLQDLDLIATIAKNATKDEPKHSDNDDVDAKLDTMKKLNKKAFTKAAKDMAKLDKDNIIARKRAKDDDFELDEKINESLKSIYSQYE